VFTRSPRASVLAFASFHLHVLGDLVGARGPDGDSWPIHYLWPFNDEVLLSWSGQWELNAWPNFVITGSCMALAFWWAWRRGVSPLEVFNLRANASFVAALRGRFGVPKSTTT
jgi:inner membrane protein